MNTIKMTIEISDEMIENLLCSAFEGGSNYWTNWVNIADKKDAKKVGGYLSEYLTTTKLKDAKLIVCTDNDEIEITKKSIIDALQKMDNPKYKHTKALKEIIAETYDAGHADCVLQMACFGEVIYG